MTFQQADSTAVVSSQDITEPTATEQQTEVAEQRHSEPVLPKPTAVSLRRDTVSQAFASTETEYQEAEEDTVHFYFEGYAQREEVAELPKYYKENYFSADSLLSTDAIGGRSGVAGDPFPYTIKSDSAITALLLACFLLVLVGLSKSRRFIIRQTKGFFNEHRKQDSDTSETSNEYRFQFLLVLQTCLLLALLAFIYTQELVDTTFFFVSNYLQIAVFFGVFVVYFTLRALIYWGVNSVFFDGASNSVWLRSLLFVTSIEGVALFPLVVVLAYTELPALNGAIYLCFVIILVKILLFYKCFVTFFIQKVFRLQIILYFCTLEIMPLLFLWGTLEKIIDCFKMNI